MCRNPLWSVGAFVPAKAMIETKAAETKVAIPSGRGIRSGERFDEVVELTPEQSRNPLWSGHSFRLKGNFCLPDEAQVAIPSGRGIRSGPWVAERFSKE